MTTVEEMPIEDVWAEVSGPVTPRWEGDVFAAWWLARESVALERKMPELVVGENGYVARIVDADTGEVLAVTEAGGWGDEDISEALFRVTLKFKRGRG